MSNQQQTTELLAMCAKFFEQELAFNQTLYGIAAWAFYFAIGLAVLHTLVQLWKSLKSPVGDDQFSINKTGAVPSPELVKAVTSFIEGLAKAPVWFFLFVAGLLLIWVSTVDVPEVCEAPLTKPQQAKDEKGNEQSDPNKKQDTAAKKAASAAAN